MRALSAYYSFMVSGRDRHCGHRTRDSMVSPRHPQLSIFNVRKQYGVSCIADSGGHENFKNRTADRVVSPAFLVYLLVEMPISLLSCLRVTRLTISADFAGSRSLCSEVILISSVE